MFHALITKCTDHPRIRLNKLDDMRLLSRTKTVDHDLHKSFILTVCYLLLFELCALFIALFLQS